MNIQKKLFIFFAFNGVLFLAISSFLYLQNNKKQELLIDKIYLNSANTILKYITKEQNTQLKNYLLSQNLQEIKNLKNYKVTYSKDLVLSKLAIVKKENTKYLIVEYLDEKRIFFSKLYQKFKKENYILLVFFLIIFILNITLFILINRLFKPIKLLTQRMLDFVSLSKNTSNFDEIQELNIAFSIMTQKINTLLMQHKDLLRDMGHELKTPIARGKFIIQKIEQENLKVELNAVFNELNSLTSTILNTQLLSKENMKISNFDIDSILLESLQRVGASEDEVEIQKRNELNFQADFSYLILAFKNLIENGLKYKINDKLYIIIKEDRIIFKNRAKRLKKEFEYYLKPFSQEDKNSEGFGIGLSLVQKIATLHNFQLNYYYKNDFIHFEMIVKKSMKSAKRE
ncbi:HAMP domain-containing histidine kinase [Sulfurimonas sediminis]|uniref:histidine kinase n=1 Tax=Sulfurimonas sediminis TaxID=2590020 RepID=A0A7M1B3A1_9BACT|nr:HAMP domain-containing histidine kinase [Sulfurimonas sediminis]QOP43996.1 HAMP domain-containing histidine kinase [Sulfurimonas sediminis]